MKKNCSILIKQRLKQGLLYIFIKSELFQWKHPQGSDSKKNGNLNEMWGFFNVYQLFSFSLVFRLQGTLLGVIRTSVLIQLQWKLSWWCYCLCEQTNTFTGRDNIQHTFFPSIGIYILQLIIHKYCSRSHKVIINMIIPLKDARTALVTTEWRKKKVNHTWKLGSLQVTNTHTGIMVK